MEALSDTLSQDSRGIWRAGKSSSVSYAEDGHAECFHVEDRSFWFRHRNNCIASMIANRPYEGVLLDIGGGNGFVARRLVDEGRRVVLLEPGETGAVNARRSRQLDNVVCATLDEAAFHPGSFGAVGLFDVIEHIQHDRELVAQCANVLAPEGRLYLTVPCHSWLWSGADVTAGHFRRHTRSSLDSMLSGLFRIDYLSGFFRPLLLPQYLLRALPYRMGIGRRKSIVSVDAEHGTSDGVVTRVISAFLRGEHARIERGSAFGVSLAPSCLIAATRL